MSLDKFKSLIPFFTLLIIFSSAIKLITYYKRFNINIIDYLELSEFTFSFVDDIYAYAITFTYSFIIWYFQDFINPSRSQLKKLEKQKKQQKFYKNLFFSYLMAFSIANFFSIYFINWIVYFVALMIIMIIYGIFVYKSLKIDIYTKYILLVPTLFIYIYFQAKLEQSKIIEGKSSVIYSISINDKEIESNKNYVFIGKTREFTFFYDIKKNETTIYNNKDIRLRKVRKDSLEL